MKKRKKLSDKEIAKLKKQSLKLSIKEGAANSVKLGTGNSFITPFALALNANNLHIGILSSFIGLIGPLAQIKSLHLMEKFSRKKIVTVAVALQALVWIPIIFLGFLFYKEIFLNYLPILLIIFYAIHVIFGALSIPAWFSWMGDLVPEKIRGRYFSKRNRITGFAMIIAMLLGGFLLDFFKTKGLVLIGFSILFLVAIFSRLYCTWLFRRHYDPGIKLKKGYYFSFQQFISQGLNNNFGRFTLFMGFFYFAIFIASPFIAVYMLKELEFSYVWFTIITLAPGVVSLVFLPFWGKISDRYGNRMVIFISSLFIPLVPILWIFSTSKIYLLLVPSVVGGIFWGAFNLSSVNFIYDSVKIEHRALCSAYYHVLIGVGVFFGSILGGIITKYFSIETINNIIPFSFSNIFIFVFLVSGILRFLAVFIFIPRIKEIKVRKKPGVLVRELRYLGHFEHGINQFNSIMNHYSHIPRVKMKFK